MMQILNVFLELNYSIVYAATAHASVFMPNLAGIGIKTQQIFLNSNCFDDFIKIEKPSVVLFDRYTAEEQFGWRVGEQCPNCIKILDTEDLHFLRKARQESIKKFGNLEHINLFSEVAKREIASILRSDLSLIISSYEIDLLYQQFKINPEILCYLPFLYDKISSDHISKLPTFEARKDCAFVGNFFHEPNLDAVHQLKKHIWPLIRKLDNQLILNIYGAYMPQKIKQLNNAREGFLVHGRAENITTVLKNARLLLAPLRFGAGIKGKLIEAQQQGTPSITTPIGAEAMSDNMLWSGCIASKNDDFAQDAVNFYNQKEEWLIAQENGFKIFNSRYNRLEKELVFKDKLRFISTNLEHHRQQNFLSSILNHHLLQSTKFMSKWINEKNKPLH
jgi:glycosyltransferase involved in cell wall biosynthesis